MIQTHSKTTHHVKPSRKKIDPSRKKRERTFKTLAQDGYSKALRRRQAALVDAVVTPENARRLNAGRRLTAPNPFYIISFGAKSR